MQSSWILEVLNICPANNSHATQEKKGEEGLVVGGEAGEKQKRDASREELMKSHLEG